MDGLGMAWLEDVLAEVREDCINDLVPYVEAAPRDPMAMAMVSVYVIQRDTALDLGMRRAWHVTGPHAPRLGIICHSLKNAQRYLAKLGDGHRITPGYDGHMRWWPIRIDAMEQQAKRIVQCV